VALGPEKRKGTKKFYAGAIKRKINWLEEFQPTLKKRAHKERPSASHQIGGITTANTEGEMVMQRKEVGKKPGRKREKRTSKARGGDPLNLTVQGEGVKALRPRAGSRLHTSSGLSFINM